MKKIIFGVAILSTLSMTAQTQIIAHRGYWKTTPATTENSLQSLGNAQKLKVFGSEFDVRMTKDGILVVNHDEHHANMLISETNYSDLIAVKLANGEDFPLLKEYLKKGKEDNSLKLIVEIKPDTTPERESEMVRKTTALIKEMKMIPYCEYISFSLHICKEIKKVEPTFKVHYLRGELSPADVKAIPLDGIDYHYTIFEKNPTWISDAKKLGLITNAWTVNDLAIYQELKKQGINFVTTDIPDQLKNK